MFDTSDEMAKLISKLKWAHIPFETNDIFGTTQVVYPSKERMVCDVVCHKFSYGYEKGLLEIMGLVKEREVDDDEVEGYLDAEEVFNRIYKDYTNRLNKQ